MAKNNIITFEKKKKIDPCTIRIDTEDRDRINFICREYNLSTREVINRLLDSSGDVYK